MYAIESNEKKIGQSMAINKIVIYEMNNSILWGKWMGKRKKISAAQTTRWVCLLFIAILVGVFDSHAFLFTRVALLRYYLLLHPHLLP